MMGQETEIMKALYGTILALAVLAIAPAVLAQGRAQASGAAPDLAAAAARDYRARANYPPWSHAVAPGDDDPVRAKYRPTRQSLSQGEGDRLVVWASDLRFERGEAATLYAQVEAADTKDPELPPTAGRRPGGGAWTITAEVAGLLSGPRSGPMSTLVYRDDGAGPDERRGDGVYSARLVLPDAFEPAIGEAENVVIVVTARNARGDELKAVGGLLYSHPAARLTGRFTDERVEGDLVIRAEADVKAAGRFHLAGTLYSLKGLPLATAQTAVELTPGLHWIELRVYGLALSERGANGPYRLGTASLSTANGIPNALGPMLENAYQTRPYLAREFHARPFGRADLLDAAERLERLSAERARRKP